MAEPCQRRRYGLQGYSGQGNGRNGDRQSQRLREQVLNRMTRSFFKCMLCVYQAARRLLATQVRSHGKCLVLGLNSGT